MRLSTAIREGSKGTKQISGKLFDGDGNNCALGAALKGAGLRSSDLVFGAAFSILPNLAVTAKCPICGIEAEVGMLIGHLNNRPEHSWIGNTSHNQTREWIADWIEREIEKPAEITERENGHPPMVANKEVMDFVGAPVEEAVLR